MVSSVGPATSPMPSDVGSTKRPDMTISTVPLKFEGGRSVYACAGSPASAGSVTVKLAPRPGPSLSATISP